MVRLATVHDYPAVSNLLSTCSKYPEAYSELSTWLLSATSRIACFSAMKIAVVVDKFQRVVGCMLIDEAPYFLHAKQICIAEKMNARLMLLHMYEFLQQYASERGYFGFSLTVETEKLSELLYEIEQPGLNYLNCSMGIYELKSVAADKHIRVMKPEDIMQLCAQRNELVEFADREQKLLIEVNKQDSDSLISLSEKYCGVSESICRAHLTDHADLVNCIVHEAKLETFLAEFFSEKLVYVDDNGQVAGYIMFRTGDQFKRCVEITDFYVRAKYVNTAIPVRLILSAGRYAALRGARIICGSCMSQTQNNFIHNYYKKAGLQPYSTTLMYAFRKQTVEAPAKAKEEQTFIFG